jgi:hypothetical protein
MYIYTIKMYTYTKLKIIVENAVIEIGIFGIFNYIILFKELCLWVMMRFLSD